jgi:hypothetical protein
MVTTAEASQDVRVYRPDEVVSPTEIAQRMRKVRLMRGNIVRDDGGCSRTSDCWW